MPPVFRAWLLPAVLVAAGCATAPPVPAPGSTWLPLYGFASPPAFGLPRVRWGLPKGSVIGGRYRWNNAYASVPLVLDGRASDYGAVDGDYITSAVAEELRLALERAGGEVLGRGSSFPEAFTRRTQFVLGVSINSMDLRVRDALNTRWAECEMVVLFELLDAKTQRVVYGKEAGGRGSAMEPGFDLAASTRAFAGAMSQVFSDPYFIRAVTGAAPVALPGAYQAPPAYFQAPPAAPTYPASGWGAPAPAAAPSSGSGGPSRSAGTLMIR